jgi:drug/metabolite transporter (DMT)-like permease
MIVLSDVGSASGSARGDLLSLGGAVMASCYLITGRRVRKEVDTLSYILPVYTIAAVLLLGITLAKGEAFTGYQRTTYICFVLLAAGPQLIGHSTLNWALHHLSATFVALCILGEPIGASLFAYFLLDEDVTLLQLSGGTLILIGIFLAARGQTNRPIMEAEQ